MGEAFPLLLQINKMRKKLPFTVTNEQEVELIPVTVTNVQDGGSSSTYLITDKVCEYVGHYC